MTASTVYGREIGIGESSDFIAAENRPPQTVLGQWYIINCIARFFPESVHILGMPVLSQLICMVCGREGPGDEFKVRLMLR